MFHCQRFSSAREGSDICYQIQTRVEFSPHILLKVSFVRFYTKIRPEDAELINAGGRRVMTDLRVNQFFFSISPKAPNKRPAAFVKVKVKLKFI